MTSAACCGCAIGAPMTNPQLQSGPLPRPAQPRDRRGELLKQFLAIPPGEWVRINTTTQRERDSVRVTAGRAGCQWFREEGTGFSIVHRKGKRK